MNHDALLSLMQARRSIRRFTKGSVSRDDLHRLLDVARWAPSNHNRQPWRFLVLQDRTAIQTLTEQVRQGVAERLRTLPFTASAYADELAEHATVFGQAPVLIVALHKQPISVAAPMLEGLPHPELVSGEPLSVAMAVQNLLLAAHALGLGACVLTAPLLAQDRFAGTLALPAGFELTCFIAVGHPDETPAAPRRKNIELIAEFRDAPPRRSTDEDPRGHL